MTSTLVSYMTFCAEHGNKAPGDWRYASVDAFVLAEGKVPNLEPFTADEETFLLRLFRMTGAARTKACYENATKLVWAAELIVRHFPDFTVAYGEGYANNSLIPVLHGVLLLNGKPVDVTFRPDMLDDSENRVRSPKKLLERARWCLTNVEYHLVSFVAEDMNRRLLAKGAYGLIDDWEHNYPLLKEGMVV